MCNRFVIILYSYIVQYLKILTLTVLGLPGCATFRRLGHAVLYCENYAIIVHLDINSRYIVSILIIYVTILHLFIDDFLATIFKNISNCIDH